MCSFFLNRSLLSLSLLLVLHACGSSSSSTSPGSDSHAASQKVVLKSDVGGVAIGTVSASAALAQVVSASTSSAIKGVQVSFAPGSLATNVDITVEQADSLVSVNTALDLKIPTTAVSAASNAVLVESSTNVDPVKPFTLEIPLPTSFRLSSTTGVLFRIIKAADPGEVFTGFLAANDFSVVNGVVKVTAAYFGAYQVVTISGDLGTVSEAVSTAPIVPIGNTFPTSGTWLSDCQTCRNNVPDCYEKDTLISNGSSIQLIYNTFADSACLLALATATTYITDLIEGSVTTPAGALAVNAYFGRFLFTPVSSLGADALNTTKFCGLTDWVVGTTQNITGLNCTPSEPTAFSAGLVYSNVLINADSPPTLRLGAPVNSEVDDGSAPAKRMLGSDTVLFTLQ